jgi:RNA:NAD 2'-phosphotransferase (TPT1/KptA family)
MKSKELCEIRCCRSNGIRFIGSKWVCNKHYWTLKYGEPKIADYYQGKMVSKRIRGLARRNKLNFQRGGFEFNNKLRETSKKKGRGEEMTYSHTLKGRVS